MKKIIVPVCLLVSISIHAQNFDSTVAVKEQPLPVKKYKGSTVKPSLRSFIVPVTLIAYGSIVRGSEELKEFDFYIKTETQEKPVRTPIDNYLQYAPGLSVFALNAAGIKAQHQFKDLVLTYFMANTIMAVTVHAIKKATRIQRPDGFGTNAFPSGHTATAFTGAEFLNQEYRYRSPWYGVAGYTAATATGILRIYNNRHWLSDVVAGAGFGILSTKTAYWLEPKVMRLLSGKNHNKSVALQF